MKKLRILYISAVVPDTTCGAHIAMYRHFVLKQDFDLFVVGHATDKAEVSQKFNIPENYFFHRLANSRFSRFYNNVRYLINWIYLPTSLVKAAKQYNPDIIFTVPDNFHLGFAYRLSRKLNKPLIANFQDVFPLSSFIPDYALPYGVIRWFLLRRFFFINQVADYVFYTSEGMRKYLGFRDSSAVLYPIGDFNKMISPKKEAPPRAPERKTIIYAGNCYGAYGRLLKRLADAIKDNQEFRLKIFPAGSDWTEAEIHEMTENGIYQHFLPFEELKKELSSADYFLTVMSFATEDTIFVKTSFTTKWLDYVPYGKPVISWAPIHASSSEFIKAHDCGIAIYENDPKAVLHRLTTLDKTEYLHYSEKALEMSETLLNAEKIHQNLKLGITEADKQDS